MTAQVRHTHASAGIKPQGECPACDAFVHQARFVDVYDENSLPPTEYLMMEVLAARHRLGEGHWTFPRGHAKFARELATKGLVQWKSGVAEGTIEVWLTQAGKDCCLSPTYQPPQRTS